ncbi:unnamed protein product [Danaus chrysippus]|uniref:(African queen) hypothetical protein n=1 Tax=Danaus chrysippus TaxID=151541 RepID=A0A8J2QWB8_9NEOP|nr:unnamed protein product [Danaus chrysippus]
MSYSNKYTFAALPRTQRGTPLVLGGDPKGKHFLYTNGNSVIIRDIENPAISDVYTEHSCQVNVAKYSPSGFYIASGDVSGKVRIWDTVNKEHILKNEFQPIGGPIKDIAWSADSQRMVVAGEGRERPMEAKSELHRISDFLFFCGAVSGYPLLKGKYREE